MLGYVDYDKPTAVNEQVSVTVTADHVAEAVRNRLVRIEDACGAERVFLGRIVGGPFFHHEHPAASSPAAPAVGVPPKLMHTAAIVEVLGELDGARVVATNTRPAPGSEVRVLTIDEVRALLRISGDMLLGSLMGYDEVQVSLDSANKTVLPRNLGIFGTVGSGKSNTCQVVIEEAAKAGWAVIILDVEGEYIEMNEPSVEEHLYDRLGQFGRTPTGLEDLAVCFPQSCSSERADATPFTLRSADFEAEILAEIIDASPPERSALQDIIDYFAQRAKTKVVTREEEELAPLLDASPDAEMPFNIGNLIERARDRGPHSTDFVDYRGVADKLSRLRHTGAFDNPSLRSIDPELLLVPGAITVFDVSVANDTVKNLVTADLLRKVFAYKIAREDTPRTLIVIEEAHTFVSKEKAATMAATLRMLRDIARRGRKRWLGLCFVSQQPGHLPAEIFELCNTRIVHNVKSMQNLEALISTAGDVAKEMWAQCPVLGPGQAILSSPQLKDPVVINLRPAETKRKFVG